MKIEFDENKFNSNIEKHGLSFEQVLDFDWNSVLTNEDDRNNYSERRFIAVGLLDNKVCVLIYTTRNSVLRIISFRYANKRERRKYEQARNDRY